MNSLTSSKAFLFGTNMAAEKHALPRVVFVFCSVDRILIVDLQKHLCRQFVVLLRSIVISFSLATDIFVEKELLRSFE